jgi:hypothetical protein
MMMMMATMMMTSGQTMLQPRVRMILRDMMTAMIMIRIDIIKMTLKL